MDFSQSLLSKKLKNKVLIISVGIFFRHCHHQIDLSRVFVVSYVIERQMKQVVNVCAHSASLDALFFSTHSFCVRSNKHTHTHARLVCAFRCDDSAMCSSIYIVSMVEAKWKVLCWKKYWEKCRTHTGRIKLNVIVQKSIRMYEMFMLMLLSLLFFVSTTKRFTFQVNKHLKKKIQWVVI